MVVYRLKQMTPIRPTNKGWSGPKLFALQCPVGLRVTLEYDGVLASWVQPWLSSQSARSGQLGFAPSIVALHLADSMYL